MSRKYEKVSELLPIVKELTSQGKTQQQIADELGLGDKRVVWNLLYRERQKEKVTAELQLHSDQGFQYTSQAYFKLTQSYGIVPSMSGCGNLYDNALAENFFSILKTECIYRENFKPMRRLASS